MEKNGTLKIAMAASNDLVADRRVARHAAALQEAGYEVVVYGRLLDDDRPCGYRWRTERLRLRHRRGWRFYAELNRSLARRIYEERPDIVWANDSDTLLGCYAAARKAKAKLVVDEHELFPEVPEIQHKPVVKWVWRTIERRLLPQADARITVCGSIAEHYRRTLGLGFEVVRNLSNAHAEADAEGAPIEGLPQARYMLLYQGAVNVGRGVDWAIAALEHLPNCSLVVAGEGDELEHMQRLAAESGWAERIVFTRRLEPRRLARLTPQADVGLVLLDGRMGLSYRYALPNRIGDFVEAGVPMVVSDLPEMSAAVRRYSVGEVVDGADGVPTPQAVAEAIKRVLKKGKTAYNFEAARADMDWQKEKQKLVAVADGLHNRSTAR